MKKRKTEIERLNLNDGCDASLEVLEILGVDNFNSFRFDSIQFVSFHSRSFVIFGLKK